MIKIIKNFNKEDCIHFKWTKAQGCCGRKYNAGVCLIPIEDNIIHKMCNTKMNWCEYQKKGEKNVHPEKL